MAPQKRYSKEEKKIFWQTISNKAAAAGALFVNDEGKVLLVKPNYRDGWLLPGGVSERGESPRETCAREIREEIGLAKPITRLLSVDYVVRDEGDQFVFVFDGGVLSEDEIASIKLQDAELDEFKFVSPEETVSMLSPGLRVRLVHALESRKKGEIEYHEKEA